MNTIKLNRERLTECREKIGLSKRAASIKMQMSQPAYLRYESGERQPSIHVVKTMADVLDTSVDYLLGNSDDIERDSFYITKEDDPDLFELIYTIKNDKAAKERITAYYQRLSKKTK